MILEKLFEFCCAIVKGFFSAVSIFNIPTSAIAVLSKITQYGSWVVGADLLIIIMSCVMFWWGLKISVGLALFIYHQIPLN